MFRSIAAALALSLLSVGPGYSADQKDVQKNIVDALKKRFPGMQTDDYVEIWPNNDAVDFYSATSHMYCEISAVKPRVKIGKCWRVHA